MHTRTFILIFSSIFVLYAKQPKQSRPLTISASVTPVFVVQTAPNSPSTTAKVAISSNNDLPAFLNAATDPQRKQYFELESNPNLAISVKRQAEDSWATNCGQPVLALYNEFLAKQDAEKAAESARASNVSRNLSPAARLADQKIRGITSNDTQTKKEMDANVEAELDRLPKKVYYELTFATQ